MLRLFFGFELPSLAREAIKPLLWGLPNARFMAEANLHVTVRFVGDVAEDQAEDVWAAVSALDLPRLQLTLNGIGSFGGNRPSHLWAGVELTKPLALLQSKVEIACQRAGLTPEGRRYHPHVTLARLHREKPGDMAKYLQRVEPFQAGPYDLDHLTLFRSYLGHSGAHYEALGEMPLSG